MAGMHKHHSHFTTSEHIVLVALTTTGEDVGLRWVDSDAAHVVMVSLEHVNLPQRVVIKHADHHVVLGERREE